MRPVRPRPGRTLWGAARALAAAALAGLVLSACGVGSDATGEADTTTASPAEGGDQGAGTGSDAGADQDDAAAAAEAVPTRAATSFDGDEVSLTDYEGTPLVVNFWASWCPPCIAEMPDLETVHQAADGRVEFIGINTQDTPEEAEDLVEETGVTYDLLRDPDGDLFRDFGVFGMPTTFYVDAEGQIVGRHTGLLTREALLADVRDQLGIDVSP